VTLRYVKGALRFCYEFVVGDDWRIAAGIVVVLAIGAILVATNAVSHTLIAILGAAGILAVALTSILTASRRR
jgi:hypothetical protein